MRVMVACEFSGIVRDAFLALGHDAISCDLLLSERPGPHWRTDIRLLRLSRFDLLIAFPPCTYLCRAGARWYSNSPEQAEALDFVRFLMDAPVDRIAIENPAGRISTAIRKPDQVIQPYQFGHGEVKKTCLWLKNLPPLQSTQVVEGRVPRVHFEAPGPDRWKRRSRTLVGIAQAMAVQWGKEN